MNDLEEGGKGVARSENPVEIIKKCESPHKI